eukprot:CAMPEP_0174836086 /NCGR_PEP_ID=MMETSP1114-20130205/5823_1 /TAXON_ID=312471 /ORGANISM="Neobodo designis, Strain CCAP 1951/1" /LENGTH=30 /DNA_ID= /DNA_START= /DNA_END= /DNA_ORIENTATION=
MTGSRFTLRASTARSRDTPAVAMTIRMAAS